MEKLKEKLASDLIQSLGLDNMLKSIIHGLVVECIDNDVPKEDRRNIIINRVNKELDRWIY